MAAPASPSPSLRLRNPDANLQDWPPGPQTPHSLLSPSAKEGAGQLPVSGSQASLMATMGSPRPSGGADNFALPVTPAAAAAAGAGSVHRKTLPSPGAPPAGLWPRSPPPLASPGGTRLQMPLSRNTPTRSLNPMTPKTPNAAVTADLDQENRTPKSTPQSARRPGIRTATAIPLYGSRTPTSPSRRP